MILVNFRAIIRKLRRYRQPCVQRPPSVLWLLLTSGRCSEVIYVIKGQMEPITDRWSLFGSGRYLRFDWTFLFCKTTFTLPNYINWQALHRGHWFLNTLPTNVDTNHSNICHTKNCNNLNFMCNKYFKYQTYISLRTYRDFFNIVFVLNNVRLWITHLTFNLQKKNVLS